MKKHAAPALAVALALAMPALAWAQSTETTNAYFGTLPIVNPPYTSGQQFIFNNGADLALAPANIFSTIDGIQTFSNKTIDCNLNTCLNFPGGGAVAGDTLTADDGVTPLTAQ